MIADDQGTTGGRVGRDRGRTGTHADWEGVNADDQGTHADWEGVNADDQGTHADG